MSYLSHYLYIYIYIYKNIYLKKAKDVFKFDSVDDSGSLMISMAIYLESLALIIYFQYFMTSKELILHHWLRLTMPFSFI